MFLDKLLRRFLDGRIETPDLEDRLANNGQNTNLLGNPNDTADKGTEYFRRQAAMMVEVPPQGLVDALQDFQKAAHDPLFGVSFLRDFLKKSQTVSEEELRKYELILDMPRDDSPYGRHFQWRYFECPFNFCLTYNGQIIASLGFNPEKGRTFINEIKGNQGQDKKLKPFKWERALVEYAVQWARLYGISEAAMVSVDSMDWAHTSFDLLKGKGTYPAGTTFEDAKRLDFETERAYRSAGIKAGIPNIYLGLMPHQGFMLYDVTAQRSGFKKAADGNYVKKLVPAYSRQSPSVAQAAQLVA